MHPRFHTLLAVILLLGGSPAHSAPARPNVLLICVDDLKTTLGCYGDPLAKTPHIDRLAARGMRFDLAYCNQAVCSASRNNLLLGSRSSSIGIYDLSKNFRNAVPDAVTMTQHFMKHGYRAEAIGKILHTGHGNSEDLPSWSVPPVVEKVVEYLKPENSAGGKLTREEAYFTNRELHRIRELPRGAAWESADVPDNAYADGRIADQGIQRLQAAGQQDAPFFLALGFVKPHLPLTAPQSYWDLHDPAAFTIITEIETPHGAPPYAGKRGHEIANYDPLPPNGLPSQEVARKLIHGYYAATSFVDAQIGRVLDELDRLELAANTIVVLWSDHGWHLGDHGIWTKHTNYEEANRIPLIVVAPGTGKPGATRQLAETVDVFPMLAELAGLPAPAGPQPIDGLSLVPVLKDPSARIRDHAYHCFPREGGRIGRAIRTDRYRLVEWKRPGEAPESADLELFDYTLERPEYRNLAEAQPEVVKEMRNILARHPEALSRPLAVELGQATGGSN
jgi:iduronate 2-sulfatase